MFSCYKKMIRAKTTSCRWSHPTQNGRVIDFNHFANANGRAWTFSNSEIRRPVQDSLIRQSLCRELARRQTTGWSMNGLGSGAVRTAYDASTRTGHLAPATGHCACAATLVVWMGARRPLDGDGSDRLACMCRCGATATREDVSADL
jgi:hypothetical protein